MKKLIFTLFFAGSLLLANATTYYWVGGTSSPLATSFTNGANWTTDPVLRVPVGGTITIGTTDIFIFDGSNLGSDPAVPITGAATVALSALTASPISGIKFINGANISLVRIGTGTSGIPVNGDGTGIPDFVIDATSTLTLGGPAYDYNVTILLGASATGSVSGNLYLGPPVPTTSYHTRCFITAVAAASMTFESGSNLYVNDSTAVSPFNGSVAFGIIFKSNASLYYYTGRSPVGSSSTLQFVDFRSGSNLYIMRLNRSYLDNTTTYPSSSWTNNKYFGNIFVQNGATFLGDGPIWRCENVTVASGSTFTLHTSGQTGILGTLQVDGTLNAPGGSTNNVVFGADGNQTVSGSGLIDVPVFTNSAVTNLELFNSITLESANTSNIYGSLDFGTSQISGPGNFSAKPVIAISSYTGTCTIGAYQLTGVSAAVSGISGQYVTGPGVASNTVVLAFSGSGGTINLSKPLTVASAGGTFSFSTFNPATLITANTGGIDGSVITTTKSFASTTSYVFNQGTFTPFSSSSPDSATNVTINGYVTTNKVINITGTLTVNTFLTIRETDSVKLRNSNPIAGGPFSNLKYIATKVDQSTGAKGVLMASGVTSTYAFPVGDPDNYLPVTVSPVSAADYFVSVFTGITQNGQPNGILFSPAQKSGVVDAVWIVNRSANIDNTTITLNWPEGLEGVAFTNFPDGQVGVSRHDGSTWLTASGSGNNTTNTALSTFNAFSPFGVGQIGAALPVKLINLAAKKEQNDILLTWKVDAENNTTRYEVERSADGISFIRIAIVAANRSTQYSITDHTPLPGTAFYRLKMIDNNTGYAYSNSVRINFNNTKSEINVYPNPVQNRDLKIDLINLNKGITEIELYNMEGKLVMRKSVQYDGGVQKTDITLQPNITRGAYLLLVKSGSQKFEQRLVVE